MKPEKIIRKCRTCGKEAWMNRTHSLEIQSMREALECDECRKITK